MAPPAGGRRYLPAEDTDLLRSALAPFISGSCLEIGFGSGAVLASVSGRFSLAVGTDVMGVEDARLASRAGVQLVMADKARCFRDRVFDVVFFNPPYLPSGQVNDQAVDGGLGGIEVPLSFLEEGLRVLREGGVVVALLSTEGDVQGFLARCTSLGLDAQLISEKRLFYETLFVFAIRRVGEDLRNPQT